MCGSDYAQAAAGADRLATVPIAGVPVSFGLVHGPDPEFDPEAPANRDHVLLRTRAFSLNFRDKAIILRLSRSVASRGCAPVGSEFAGEVVSRGAAVTDLRPGDRVMSNPAYPTSGVAGLLPGLPTNGGSAELQAFHRAKLMKIPEAMSDEVAASFSIGAQTSYGMIRRLGLKPGENVLVTAARSNTSLFAIQALRHQPVDVYAVTTSARHERELRELGISRLFRVDPDIEDFGDDPELLAAARACRGFQAVIDPFSDLFLPRVLDVMAVFGRYITCGIYNQYLDLVDQPFRYRGKAGPELLMTIVFKMISVLGNCLGDTRDLERASDDYAAGKLAVTLDSVHRGDDVGPFLERTYNAPDRLGKVVFRYD